MPIPPGLTREHILAALSDLDAGIPTRFGRSVKYDLVYEGRRYSPKAVLAQAIARMSGAVPDPYAFTGGSMTNSRLVEFGFEVVPK